MIKTQAQITAEILTNVSDPLNKQNTPAKLRQVLDDLNDTMFGGAGQTLEASVSISAAQIATMYATPIEIVASPGVGKYIEAISASAILTYVSQAYITNTSFGLWCAGAGSHQLANAAALLSTATRTSNFYTSPGITGASTTQIVENTALQVKMLAGEVAVGIGNGTLVVKVLYRIVTV